MTTTPDDAAAYDPETHTDSDPANLNPRTGAAAAGGAEDDPDADTDADPANLNPRDDTDTAGSEA